MSYVKINDTELTNMSTNVQKAFDALDEVEDIWGNKFAELYADFVDSGFLDSLYEDAESNFYQCLRAATAIGAASSVFLLIPVGGWIAWVVSILFGVVAYALQGDPQWLTVSKEAFIQLLASCKNYQDDNYIRISNLATKFYNIQLSIEKIRSKVDAFQSAANQVGATAEQMGLSTRIGGSDDGILLGIETEIVIDGETITMDASEAMSALYTYAYTVTSSMIAADYLERTYGYEIDYLGLVANANAFMADTIKNDMYTPEMINLILPSYTPDEKAAYTAASAATGLSEEELQKALGDVAALGANSLFAGLVGASLIGNLKPDKNDTTGNPDGTTPGTTPGNPSGGPSGRPSGGTTGRPSGGTTGGETLTGGVCSVCGKSPCICAGNYNISAPIETDVPVDQDITIDLGIVGDDGKVDYDQLAMEEYQFDTPLEEIESYRLELMDDIESKYASGDFTSITKQLQDYGYGTAEIATILASKSMTINAIMDGETRQILAAKAQEMAKADGVTDYKSSYSNRPSTDELDDSKKPLRSLHLNSTNKKLVDMESKLDELETDYRTKVDSANTLLDEAQVNKKAVDAIKEKYEKEYGTDTSKWTKDAAKEYDDAIDKYNTSAKAANKAIDEANKAKESYRKSREDFEKACEEYYQSKIPTDDQNNDPNGSISEGTNNPGSSNNQQGDSGSSNNNGSDVTINEDGSVTFGDGSTTGNSNNNSGSGTSNNNGSDVTINDDGTVTFNSDGSIGNSASTNKTNASLNVTSNNDASVATNTTSSAVNATSGSSTTYIDQDAFLAALGLKSDSKDKN